MCRRRENFLHFGQFEHGRKRRIGLHFVHGLVAFIFCLAQVDEAALEVADDESSIEMGCVILAA